MGHSTRSTLTVWNRTYNLKTENVTYSYTNVHIVRITNEDDIQITSARIYGDWDTAHKAAKEWWMRLLAANPGMLLQMTMEAATSDMYQ